MKYLQGLVFCFVALAVLASCAALPVNYAAPAIGEVYSVSPGTVAYGIRAALVGAPGTSILTDGTNYLVVWTYRAGAAAGFYCVGCDAAQLLRGNLANSQTVSDLVASLRAAGWQNVAPGAAPAVLVELAGSRLVSAPVLLLAVGVFPGGFESWFESTFYAEEVQG